MKTKTRNFWDLLLPNLDWKPYRYEIHMVKIEGNNSYVVDFPYLCNFIGGSATQFEHESTWACQHQKETHEHHQILNNNQRRAHAWHKPRRGWQSVTHVKLGFQNPLNMGDMIKNPCGNVGFKIKSSWVKPFGGNLLSWCQTGGVVSGRSFRS